MLQGIHREAINVGDSDASGAGTIDSSPPVLTVGHSNRSGQELLELLLQHRVGLLVDVRRYPTSRRHPQFRKDKLNELLASEGIEYRHEEDLGGYRRPRPDSPNTAWESEGFRGYADYLTTPSFQDALKRVRSAAAGLDRSRPPRRVTLMCAEQDPLRCHRRLIADVLQVRGHSVRHLIDPDRSDQHELTEFARVQDDRPVYPGLFNEGNNP